MSAAPTIEPPATPPATPLATPTAGGPVPATTEQWLSAPPPRRSSGGLVAVLGAGTIRRRLGLGFALLMALLAAGGFWGWRSLNLMSTRIGETLAAVQSQASLSSKLTTDIAQEIEAADHYVSDR
ncbi:MAG: hypothetical protein ACJ79S_00945, partial [Gemmatimonadaceae bacterium]